MSRGTATRALPAAAAFALLALALPACSATGGAVDDTDAGGLPALDASSPAVGCCSFTVAGSERSACRDYTGEGWTVGMATADCDAQGGQFAAAAACPAADAPAVLGACTVRAGSQPAYRDTFPGPDSTQCAAAKRDCVVYAGGSFSVGASCSEALPAGAAAGGLPVFEPPTLECVPPKAGEPPGRGPGGKVCTYNAIAASTEEGRKFVDYGSCRTIFTQRPYYPVRPNTPPAERDARLDDPTYAAELAWVKSQIESSACVCCHSQAIAPRGPSQWYIEAPNNFISSFFDSGLALGANWIDSTAFGAYDPSLNNGFDRIHSGFPSTDPARMVAFFQAELKHRGKGQADFAGAAPFGGPLATQRTFQPKACANGEGVGEGGAVTWSGGPARYLYVLAEGSANPTVPPNLDLPQGTLWRLDVPPTGRPLREGEVTYGKLPAGTSQRFPEAGAAPAPLTPGTRYYLYVLADVGIPITRCLFTR